MRGVLLWIGAGCGSTTSQPIAPIARPPSIAADAEIVDAAIDAPPPPPAPPDAPPPPRLPMLRTTGTMFAIVTEGTKASCREWQIVGDGSAFGKLVIKPPIGRTEELKYQTNATLLFELGVEVGDGELRRCHVELEANESASGIEFTDGGRWFRSKTDCTAALAKKERVAVDLSECLLRPKPSEAAERATAKRLETLLSRGGEAYAVVGNRCMTLKATVTKRGEMEGTLDGSLYANDGLLRGLVSYAYKYDPGTLELRGPTIAWANGTSTKPKCISATFHGVKFGVDAIELDQPLYLTAAACRTELAHETELRAWLPAQPDLEPQIALTCQTKRWVRVE